MSIASVTARSRISLWLSLFGAVVACSSTPSRPNAVAASPIDVHVSRLGKFHSNHQRARYIAQSFQAIGLRPIEDVAPDFVRPGRTRGNGVLDPKSSTLAILSNSRPLPILAWRAHAPSVLEPMVKVDADRFDEAMPGCPRQSVLLVPSRHRGLRVISAAIQAGYEAVVFLHGEQSSYD